MKTSLAAGRRIYAWWATVQGDAAHMRLANDSLDGALCTLELSAMPQPELAIRQVHRCLKPEGRFVVLDAKLAEGAWSIFNPPSSRLRAHDELEHLGGSHHRDARCIRSRGGKGS